MWKVYVRQIKLLEMKTTLSEVKNPLVRINSKLDVAEENITDFGHCNSWLPKWNTTIKNNWTNEQSIPELWDNSRWPCIDAIGVSQRERAHDKYLKKYFPNLMRTIRIQIWWEPTDPRSLVNPKHTCKHQSSAWRHLQGWRPRWRRLVRL